MSRLRSRYEALLRPYAHYPPDYSLTRMVRDGRLRAPRLVVFGQWSLYAAAMVAAIAGVAPRAAAAHSIGLVLAGVLPLWAIKVMHVYSAAERPRALWHQPDPLDWLCDVGACGTAGALSARLALIGIGPSPWVWLALLALFAATYAWSSP